MEASGKAKRINLETKRIPLKACSGKKKSQGIPRCVRFKGSDEESKGLQQQPPFVKKAIEEGILGVYRSSVACYALDGRRTLVHFYLTDSKPTGKIAMKMSRLIFLKSRFKNMKAVKEDLEINLEKTHKSLQGKKKTAKMAAKLIRLEKQYKDIKGIRNMLYRQIRLQTPKAWKERSNPEGWSNPRLHTTEICRRHNAKDYDYYSNFKNFGPYVGVKASPLLLNRVHHLVQSNRDAKGHL